MILKRYITEIIVIFVIKKVPLVYFLHSKLNHSVFMNMITGRLFLKSGVSFVGICSLGISNSLGYLTDSVFSYNLLQDRLMKSEWRCINLQMSGGINSALLGYFLAKIIVDNDLGTRIRRITFGFGDDSKNVELAKKFENVISNRVGRSFWIEAF